MTDTEHNSGSSGRRDVWQTLSTVTIILLPLSAIITNLVGNYAELYWNGIGVEPDDLGVNLGEQLTRVGIFILLVVGLLGPFIVTWSVAHMTTDWLTGQDNRLAN